MNPGDEAGDAPVLVESTQTLLESIGFRIHLTFPDLLAIDPEEDDG